MEESLILRDVLIFCFKHKVKMITIFVLLVGLVTAVVLIMPPVYEATAMLIVKPGREYLYHPEVEARNTAITEDLDRPREELISSEIQILTSRSLIKAVVSSFGAGNLYPDLVAGMPRDVLLANAIQTFEKSLFVGRVEKSDVIRVSFQHTSPEMAAEVVRRLIEEFKAMRVAIFNDPQTTAFLTGQVENYHRQLRVLEVQREAFKQRYTVFAHPEQQRLLAQRYMKAAAALEASSNQYVALQQKATVLQRHRRGLKRNTPLQREIKRDASIDSAKSRLLELQLDEQKLLEKYKASHPKMIAVRREIRKAQAFLRQQAKVGTEVVRIGKNRTYEELEKELFSVESELQAEKARREALKEQFEKLDKEFQVFIRNEREFLNIQRQIDMVQKNYRTYAKKMEQARISSEMDRQKIANIRMVQAPEAPSRPIRPKKKASVAIGVFLATFASFGVALVSEYVGQGIHTPESAERYLDLPVLTTVAYKRLG